MIEFLPRISVDASLYAELTFHISRSIVARVPLTETVILGTVLAGGIRGILYVLQDHSKSAERFLVFHGIVSGKRPLMS